MICLSPSEGRRFGLKAARLETECLDPVALRETVLAEACDWLVLRLPSGLEREIERLRVLGLEPQQTDTLATWTADLEQITGAAPTVSLDPARVADADAISDLVRSVFRRYPNHYTANPLLRDSLALEGYVEWALSHIDSPERLCWVVRLDGHIAGLSCSRHESATGIAVGVLHGVDPRFSGRGLYRQMLEASLAHYREAGYREFRISTQAANLTVQNLWSRLGFRLLRNQSTVHLMPMLGFALSQPAQDVCDADALVELAKFDAARLAGTAMRRCVSVFHPDRIAQAARLHNGHWPREDGLIRQVSLLADRRGLPLAVVHSDCAPFSAAP
jgi:ribosomal protein S18 acetylase RimI-like enzyme